MKALFYKGEDIVLTFTSVTDMSGYTKVVKFFTFGSAVKTAAVTAVDNYNFTAKLAKADTADLKTGRLNIVLEFTDGSTNKTISKTIDCKLADAYIDGEEREAVATSNDVVFVSNMEMTVSFLSTIQVEQSMSGKVSKSGNETIAGVKTFSSSPIIPAPTTDMQPATKKYIDDKVKHIPGTSTSDVLSQAAATKINSKRIGKVLGKNLLDKAAMTDGYYVNNTNGNLSSNALYSSSEFIEVTEGQEYITSGTGRDNTNSYYAWYNESFSFISGGVTLAKTAPTGAKYIRVSALTANKNTSQLEAGSASTAYEAYNDYYKSVTQDKIADGAVSTIKIGDKAVTIAKAAFVNEVIGKNKFNINASDVSLGNFVSNTSGLISANASYNVTGYIPVTGGQAYTLSYKHSIAWYDSNKTYISGSASTDTSKQQTAPANAAFLRCTVILASWTLFQVEEGSVQTVWEEWISTMLFTGVKVAAADVSGIDAKIAQVAAVPTAKTGKNKFNINDADVTSGYYVNNTTGNLSANANYSATGFIPVEAGKTYTLSVKSYMAWYNSSKIFLSGSSAADTSKQQTAPAGAAYLRASVSIPYTLANFQVEEGTAETTWEAYVQYNALQETISFEGSKIVGLKAALGYLGVNKIAMPKKQYFLGGYENTIYHEAITERYIPDLFSVQIENGSFVNRKALSRITNPVADASVDAKLYDIDFNVLQSINFALVVGAQATNNGAVAINAIGDSLTYNGSYLKRARELCPDLSFIGIRVPYGDTGIVAEGRGGWKLDDYFNKLHQTTDSFSPFMHLADPYKYYGNTDFWKKVVNGDVSYGYGGFAAKATSIGFSGTTGLKTSPVLNDVMYNDTNARYELYDGAAWVAFSAVAGDFTFNYGKYRSIWGISQPSIVTVMLGTNDFSSATAETISSVFSAWKTQFESLVTSVHADSPSAKIALLISPSVWGGSNYDIDSPAFNKRYNAAMWRARNLIISNFDSREVSDKIYLVDVGCALDPVYGFTTGTAEKPFSDYAGTETVKVQSNNPHPSTEGYYQMGVKLAGFIQSIR